MKRIRIGTRGSPLALAQTYEALKALERYEPKYKDCFDIVSLKTTGDAIVDRSLMDSGGKSLFTKEIEDALLQKRVDIAVHSMKDMTVDMPSGLIVPAMLKREDPRDALITYQKQPIEHLQKGAIFGTSSLRRQAFVLSKYHHLEVVPLRGNVQTRLQKIESGIVQASLLAVAGLKRLGLLEKATEILSVDDYIPAVGQGAIGIQCREDDKELYELLSSLNHIPTFQAVTAERAFMKALHGSCRTPLAAFGIIDNNRLLLKGMVSDPQGQHMHFTIHEGASDQPERIGEEAAQSLLDKRCHVF